MDDDDPKNETLSNSSEDEVKFTDNDITIRYVTKLRYVCYVRNATLRCIRYVRARYVTSS